MLMALRFEPSRFFLKGKVTQKQTSYKHKHTVREEVSQVWNEHKRRRNIYICYHPPLTNLIQSDPNKDIDKIERPPTY